MRIKLPQLKLKNPKIKRMLKSAQPNHVVKKSPLQNTSTFRGSGVLITKEVMRGHLRNLIMQTILDSNYTTTFIFEMDAIPFENGKLVNSQSFVYQNNKSSIIFYLDNMMREFLNANKGLYLKETKANIEKLNEYFKPILIEQLFSISKPGIENPLTNPNVN